MSETPPSTSDDARTAESVETACTTLLGFLDRLACIGKAHAMDNLAATDLTFSQMRVLFALGAHGDGVDCMSLNEIADHVSLSLAAAGRTVDKLVVAGLVDRREDPTDRRVKRVSLTTEGSALVDSQLDIKHDIVRTFVTGLPERLRNGLHDALGPIIDSDVDFFSHVGDSIPTDSSSPDTSQKVGS